MTLRPAGRPLRSNLLASVNSRFDGNLLTSFLLYLFTSHS
jgi:hypothetical protein